jgi:FdhE protein
VECYKINTPETKMTATPILQPGQMEAAAGDIPELRLPPATLFACRAQRLRQLAEGHSLGDYLHFVAVLAECQQRALEQHPAIPAPDAQLLANCRAYAMPPLAPAGWRRHPHWREMTRTLAEAMVDQVPAGGREAFTRLLNPNKEWLEAQADNLLAQNFTDLNLATAPLIGAALQVQWTYLARQLQAHQVARPEEPVLCPACGSPPVASIIHMDGSASGLRYLHCALCGSEWHVVRSKCSHCDNSKGITYYSIEGGNDIVRAETCPACHSYLKIIHQDKDSRVDPVADDLATLALDLLMGEKNLAKSSINFLMLQGKDE